MALNLSAATTKDTIIGGLHEERFCNIGWFCPQFAFMGVDLVTSIGLGNMVERTC
jgi:hypothetical protein